jgi:thiamine kinase-like enzyme
MLGFIEKIYGFREDECMLVPFGNGLINQTWLLEYRGQRFVLQKINESIFKDPGKIENNIHQLGIYFKQHFPGYFFVHPVVTSQNKEMFFLPGEGYFRLFEFVNGSITHQTVTSPAIAFEGAKQFAKFTHLLAAFNPNTLHITLPDFHNLALRYQQFETAVEQGNKDRITAASASIAFIRQYKNIADTYNQIQTNTQFKKRVTHHDTKISNVLFDKNGRGLCVIDLDTVMPGYFISDVGDMIRTYTSPVSEEEQDFSKINLREDYFMAIVDGYLSEMKDDLSAGEKKYFVYAGKCMIYMQALRFLTDHFNNDIYYGAKYEGHNCTRGNNQIELLKQLLEKEDNLQKKINKFTGKISLMDDAENR